MSNMLEYKGYHTKVLFDVDSHVLHGKVEGIRDFVNFETPNPCDVVKEFHEAVDDYLAFCEEVGKSPDKEYRGTFNVRINPSLHRELAMEADRRNISMNQLVETAIDAYFHEDRTPVNITVCVKENETKSSANTPAIKYNFPSNDYYANNSRMVAYGN